MKRLFVLLLFIACSLSAISALYADETEDLYSNVIAGDITKVKSILEASPELLNTQNSEEWTPLHGATSQGHTELVKLLLNKGAKINSPGKKGYTPLHLACQNGYDTIGLFLLENGAEVNARGYDGATPLYLASENNRYESVEMLISNGAKVNISTKLKKTPLIVVMEKRYEKVAVLLIEKGADVNASNMEGLTPLHFAVMAKQPELVELLVTRNADINAKSDSHMTPLSLAVARDDQEMIKMLKKKGGKDPSSFSTDWGCVIAVVIFIALMLAGGFLTRTIARKFPQLFPATNPDWAVELPPITGIAGMTRDEVSKEVERGAQFIRFKFCVSVIIAGFKDSSGIYFKKPGESLLLKSLPWTLASFVFGWWSLQGLVWTLEALATNFAGGEKVTEEVIPLLGLEVNQHDAE